jgi:glycosyltransferase involved in cell wall biosynthesis
MKVLVVIPTYGRIPYLNRALASFLAQDYPDKHLLIINDDKHVTLKCDSDNVTCMNLNRRILLPQKRNIGSIFGYYDLIMQYDDDDIMMPERITNHVNIHTLMPEISYYRNTASYAVDRGVFEIGICSPNACSYKQDGWFKVNGYTNKKNIGDDIEFWQKIDKKYEITDNAKVDYVYNWSGINFHTTWEPPHIEQIAYEQLEIMDLVGKDYHIVPDFTEYNKFLQLREIFNRTGSPVKLRHIEDAKIEIIQ